MGALFSLPQVLMPLGTSKEPSLLAMRLCQAHRSAWMTIKVGSYDGLETSSST